MHLFLIRHGESEHNVAGLLAGVSDSRLTNHGILQTQRLGKYLTTHRNLRFTHIFASDLQRAFMTAEELQRSQIAKWVSEHRVPNIVKLELLREQDFGSLELVPWASRRAQNTLDPCLPNSQDPSFRPQETPDSMANRADLFVADFILPLFACADDTRDPVQDCVAVVSHGLFLSALWQSLLTKFNGGSVFLGPDVEILRYGRPLEYFPSWSNTGFLELTVHQPTSEVSGRPPYVGAVPEIQATSLPFGGHSMTIHTVNGKDHLTDLKRTRGGLGSSPFDARQKSLDGFFKRPKQERSRSGDNP